MKLLCVVGLALIVCISVSEARSSRHYGRHARKYYEQEEPNTRQIQVEEPKPVEIEPEASPEVAVEKPAEKPRPVRARKAPVLCNANAAAAKLDKPDKVETSSSSESAEEDDGTWEVISPMSAESVEVEPLDKPESPAKSKKIEKPRGKVVPASEEYSESVEEDEDADDDSKNNFSVALASIEEQAPPKALTNDEIPDEQGSRAVESQEEEIKPKARRSKHHRKDVRRIDRPHRRRVIFRDEDDE